VLKNQKPRIAVTRGGDQTTMTATLWQPSSSPKTDHPQHQQNRRPEGRDGDARRPAALIPRKE